MQRKLRSVCVVALVATLAINPATACHYCGSQWGGYSDYGYYESGYDASCSDGCGSGCYDAWHESTCCGEDVVVYDGCGACDGCSGCEEAPSQVEPPMAAPEPPAEAAPSVPPQPMPGATDAEMHAMPPVEPPVEQPALPTEEPAPPAEPSDDLFSEPAAPAEEPAPPAESTDDLFSEPAAEPAAPAEEPSAPAESDDLFGTPEEPATDSAPATPAEDATSEPSGDDLFAPETEEATPPAEDETTPPAEEREKESDDDLFGDSGAILRMPGGLASSDLRQWVDNTGRYSCRGRLIRVLEGKVQLRKENGRTTTVSFGRLCQADLEFAHRQASAQRAETIGQTAQVAPTWSN